MSAVLLVSRNWHNPHIAVSVVKYEPIEIAMDVNDFKRALLAELGNPAMILTSAQLEKRLNAAIDRVVQGMKDETARVV